MKQRAIVCFVLAFRVQRSEWIGQQSNKERLLNNPVGTLILVDSRISFQNTFTCEHTEELSAEFLIGVSRSKTLSNRLWDACFYS